MQSENNNSSNKFPLPQCWSSDVRMDVLFAPFRPRNVNPENYDSKMKFWKGMITKYCEHKGSSDFCKSQLQTNFIRNHKIPHGLQNVIDDMIANKEIRLKSEFLNDPLNTWRHWAVNNFVKKPFNWSIYLLATTVTGGGGGGAGAGSQSPLTTGGTSIGASGKIGGADDHYIHLEVLQNQSEALLERLQQQYTGKVLSLEKIIELEKSKLNEEGTILCLHYLHSRNKLFLEQEGDNKRKMLIKIAGKHEIASPLTETDRALFKLEQTQERILKEIEILECDIKLNNDKCRQYIREGNKSLAKNYLKKKHLFEDRINKKHNSLDNIHSLLIQVQEAQSHGEILDAYKIGSTTLKNILSNPELNLNTVDEITANVKNAMEIHGEIQNTLGSISMTDSIADDSLLEKELNELLDENKETASKDLKEKEIIDGKSGIIAAAVAPEGNKLDDELLEKLEKLKVESSLLLLADTAMNTAKKTGA